MSHTCGCSSHNDSVFGASSGLNLICVGMVLAVNCIRDGNSSCPVDWLSLLVVSVSCWCQVLVVV